jgi:uncharacterized membrane protein
MEEIKNWFNKNRLTLIVGILLTAITVVAAFLRFCQIGKLSFWNDEIDTVIFTAPKSLYAMFQGLWPKEVNMALYYLLAHYWVRVLPGMSEGSLRAISAIFSVVSIPVVFLLGVTLGVNRKQATVIGLTAALLVAINAFHIQYAQEFRSYSLVFLLATLSTLLLIKAVKNPKSPLLWTAYALVSVAAVYCHYFVVFLLLAQGASLFVLFLGDIHTFPFKGIIGSGVTIIILLIPLALATHLAGTGGLSWDTAPTFSSIKNLGIELTGNQGETLYALYLLASLIGILVKRVWLQKDLIRTWSFTLIVSSLILPISLMFVFSRLITPIFADRYLLFTMPYLAVLTAIGIVELVTARSKVIRVIGIVILLTIVGLSVFGVKNYFEKYQKEDWRGVSQFLTEKCPTSLRLYYMAYREKNATYYNSNLKSQSGWWIDNLIKNSSSEKNVGSLPNGYEQVCLVLANETTQQNSDQIKIIQSVVRAKFPNVTKFEFTKIDIEIYEQ